MVISSSIPSQTTITVRGKPGKRQKNWNCWHKCVGVHLVLTMGRLKDYLSNPNTNYERTSGDDSACWVYAL
eukprot:scaffold8452_cov185-Ochromonas_danica.AAC.25